MAKGNVVLVRATVERASPDRTQYKPYQTDLTFDGNLEIEIPVDAEHVIEKKGEKIVLTVAGYASLLETYTKEIERMNDRMNNEKFNPKTSKPLF
jgi:hypothetical protein